MKDLAAALHSWPLQFSGTEGYPKAEVTLGGVDTAALSSKTMEVRQVPDCSSSAKSWMSRAGWAVITSNGPGPPATLRGKPSNERRSTPPTPSNAVEAVKAIYRELAERPIERNCIQRTECCRFRLTGRTPFLTKGEALVAAKAVRASDANKCPRVLMAHVPCSTTRQADA